MIEQCMRCKDWLEDKEIWINIPHTDVFYCKSCFFHDQPERSKREDRYIGGYFSPPWNPDQFPEKTKGWIAFQEEQRKDPKYYGCGALNTQETE